MTRLITYVLGLLFAVSFFLPCRAYAGEEVLAPMCTEVIGFAGEYNSHIRIGVPVSPAEKEAIVLVLRAFPLNLGELSQRWIQMNVTYRLREGSTVFLQSDNDGIAVIQNVEAGTNMDIEVKRVRKDGPVPFRFWSFHANRPSCHIDVSPTNSFLAPIPARFGKVATPVRVYFKSIAPQGAKGFILDITYGFFSTSPVKYEVMQSPTSAAGLTRTSGEVVPWSEGVAYMTFSPSISTETLQLLQVKIVWVDDITAAGGTAEGVDPTVPPEEFAKKNATPSEGTSKEPSSQQSKAGDKKRRSVLGLVFILLFSLAVFMLVMSFVNYRLKGATEFPEMIPFVGFFRSCGQYVSLATEAFMRGRGNHRGGYSDLSHEAVSTDRI
ncbi:hypothetical protein C3747_28g78 [Trypanosoma cruzi]|uniref:Uncharacterized protein n=1 Tax=Trypanosoma cruzi TaxID=5693 RepID=A0A2V2X4A0_TRYCR|nr:putative Autophagy-related protein 27 [Trypanosoma cruzi]PWV15636.1 hypothetical protein C3747_28g78 [Trypanosoma cruzi]